MVGVCVWVGGWLVCVCVFGVCVFMCCGCVCVCVVGVCVCVLSVCVCVVGGCVCVLWCVCVVCDYFRSANARNNLSDISFTSLNHS